jgi:TPR repeat protein
VKLWLICVFTLGLAFGLCAADFEAGKQAYEKGDYAGALKEWQPLAEKGAPHAQYNVGLIYAKGLGVMPDPAKAAEWYRKAAEQGIIPAQYNLALMLASGEGVAKDPAEALKWFQKAADRGDMQAATGLAAMLEDESAFKNPAEAEKWYRKSAEQGVASAQFNLAVMYDIGQGVQPDFNEAVKWYTKAADQGYAPALCNLGILYYNGQGVKLDRLQAQQYFLMAKAAGEPRAESLMQWTTNKLDKKQQKKAEEYASNWNASHKFSSNKADSNPNFASDQELASNTPAPDSLAAKADIKPVTKLIDQADENLSTLPESVRPSVLSADLSAAQNESAIPLSHVSTVAMPALVPALHTANEREAEWNGVEKVVAIGDLDGDYGQFVAVLRSAGLVDQNNRWSGGKTHLVQTGDVLGQAGSSRQIMDLLMALERQAAEAGGAVHCLIGREEAMNLTGDLRQVSPSEYGMFRDQSSADLRNQYYKTYLKNTPATQQVSEGEWLMQHPLGFYERESAFGVNGFYGQWLLSHDAVVKINDTLYVNAGLGEREEKMSLAELNDRVRHELSDWHMLDGGIVMDPEGPLRFHGLSEDGKGGEAHLDHVLNHYGVKRIVIGHSDAAYTILPRYQGRVILIDAALSRRSNNTGNVECLIEDQGKLMALYRGVPIELPKDEDADLLRYLKQAAALDPAPSPLEPRIKLLEARKNASL